MSSRSHHRVSSPGWVVWILVILAVGLVAGGFVGIRNAQVRSGHSLKEVEVRMAALESEIEMYEARIAGLTSREALTAKLRAKKSRLQRMSSGDVVRLPGPGAQEAKRVPEAEGEAP